MIKKTRGFTIVELMIVIAIIGILATLAMISYRQYVERAAFADVITSTFAIKRLIEVCAQTKGTINTCLVGSYPGMGLAQAGAASSTNSKNVHSVLIRLASGASATGPVEIEAQAGGQANRRGVAQRTNYVIAGRLDSNGQVNWQLDKSQSNCDDRGVCG